MLTQFYHDVFYALLPIRGGSARSLRGDWVNQNRPFWDLGVK